MSWTVPWFSLSYMLGSRYGSCVPRGGPSTGDNTVAKVGKAHADDSLEAITVASDGAAHEVTLTRAHACVVLQQALLQELVQHCGSTGMSLLMHVCIVAVSVFSTSAGA